MEYGSMNTTKAAKLTTGAYQIVAGLNCVLPKHTTVSIQNPLTYAVRDHRIIQVRLGKELKTWHYRFYTSEAILEEFSIWRILLSLAKDYTDFLEESYNYIND